MSPSPNFWEPVDKAKPFDIPKREVWEAFKRVKANQGAAGVDGQSIADFEADLSNNLYKLWNRLSSLALHPEKTKIVYCKDVNRRGDYPNQSFDFLGFAFRARKTVWHGHRYVHGFRPAVSPKALKAMRFMHGFGSMRR